MKTQTQEILAYLQAGNTITSSYAINKFRCHRLGARIYDIRRLGYNVKSERVKRKSKRTGRIVQFAQYSLEG